MAACSARSHPPDGGDYYALGQHAFAVHDYRGAIEYFQKLIDQYPFNPYVEDADLKIGLAQYQLGHYPEAIASLSDFEKMYPTSQQMELASYYQAMSHFNQIGRPDQDQTNTEKALQQFKTIERRYPETGFSALAHQRIAICREMLARHELLIGNFYYERANFRAAESRLAELMSKWADTPVGDQALYELGLTLEKEGKKYSAAQAFSAEVMHYPGSLYAKKAQRELKHLHQPVDTEADPLNLVLAESGFAYDHPIAVRQGGNLGTSSAAGDDSGIYGSNGLPDLERAAKSADTSGHTVMPGSVAAASPAAAAAAGAFGSHEAAAESHLADGSPGALQPAKTGPATLNKIRLSSANPPLSVIFDLTGPVSYENKLKNGTDHSTLTIRLNETKPSKKLHRHLVFDRSIFRDCDVQADAKGTTVTVNTAPVSRFAIVPLNTPPRLLITFTPEQRAGLATQAAANSGL